MMKNKIAPVVVALAAVSMIGMCFAGCGKPGDYIKEGREKIESAIKHNQKSDEISANGVYDIIKDKKLNENIDEFNKSMVDELGPINKDAVAASEEIKKQGGLSFTDAYFYTDNKDTITVFGMSTDFAKKALDNANKDKRQIAPEKEKAAINEIYRQASMQVDNLSKNLSSEAMKKGKFKQTKLNKDGINIQVVTSKENDKNAAIVNIKSNNCNIEIVTSGDKYQENLDKTLKNLYK